MRSWLKVILFEIFSDVYFLILCNSDIPDTNDLFLNNKKEKILQNVLSKSLGLIKAGKITLFISIYILIGINDFVVYIIT